MRVAQRYKYQHNISNTLIIIRTPRIRPCRRSHQTYFLSPLHRSHEPLTIRNKMGSIGEESRLFEPLQIGPYRLSSRLVMAPLTRFRADDSHIQLPFVKEYYTQRACVPGTLQITEATFISPRASGYPNVPGIWSKEQISAWKEVVESVHKAGGIIFLQLWALGRTANPQVKQKEGTGDLVSSSAVPENSDKTTPRPLTEEEIWEYIEDYATAAKNAVEGAGFDGVGKSCYLTISSNDKLTCVPRNPRCKWISSRPVRTRCRQPADGQVGWKYREPGSVRTRSRKGCDQCRWGR